MSRSQAAYSDSASASASASASTPAADNSNSSTSSSPSSVMLTRWISQWFSHVGLHSLVDSLDSILVTQLKPADYQLERAEAEIRMRLFALRHLLADSPSLVDNLDVGLSHLHSLTLLAGLDSSSHSRFYQLTIASKMRAAINLIEDKNNFLEQIDYLFAEPPSTSASSSPDSSDGRLQRSILAASKSRLLEYFRWFHAKTRNSSMLEFESINSKENLEKLLQSHLNEIESRLELPAPILSLIAADVENRRYEPGQAASATERLSQATKSLAARLHNANQPIEAAEGQTTRSRRRLDESDPAAVAVAAPQFSDQELISQRIDADDDETEDEIDQFPSQKLKLPAVRKGGASIIQTAAKRMKMLSAPSPAAASASASGGRVPFSPEEVKYLLKGLSEFRTERNKWSLILTKYAEKFEPHRRAMDLKDKWRNLEKKIEKNGNKGQPAEAEAEQEEEEEN